MLHSCGARHWWDPGNPTPKHSKSKALHQALAGQDRIEESFAASGGISQGPSSWWVFKLADYGSLERLHKQDDPVSIAYTDFLSEMIDVQDMIREEVLFL